MMQHDKNILSKDDKNTIHHFTALAEQFGQDVRTLNWGSRESQHKRFAVLAEIGDLNQKKILDVGCGLGDFYAWLQANNIDTDFHGIDITPKLIEMASKRFPNISFESGQLHTSSTLSNPFDFVFASGIFYLRQEDPVLFMQSMIQKMFELCTHGIAFNSLSSWSKDKAENEFYADPIALLNFCKQLTTQVVLRHDYHPRDFTMYLYKTS
ncbi:MAG: class I SAM-dependent methyltransferase [Pseudomonadota bacterium]